MNAVIRPSISTASGPGRDDSHSEKAMRLAKKMRRTRQKEKTGHVICHHLRMMLTEEPSRQRIRQNPGTPVVNHQERDNPQFSLGF